MAEVASLMLAMDSSQVKTAEKDLSALATTANRVSNEVDKLPAANNNVARSARTMSDSIAKSTNSFGLAKHQMANFSQQLQDVVVSLGSGQSAFTVLLQQGPQITSAFGGMSASLGILRQGLSAIGPVGIAAFGAIGTAALAVGKILGADGVRRDMEKIADQFRILQTGLGGQLNIANQMDGISNAAKRTGVSFESLARAQRDFVEASMKGGTLTRDSVFGADIGNISQTTEAVELLARGLEASGLSASQTGPIVEKFFYDLRHEGSLSSKTLDEIITQAPQLGRALVSALGGSSKLFYNLSQGAKIGAKESLTALLSIRGPIDTLAKNHIPSIGAAFDIMRGKANNASTEISLAFGKKTQGFADGLSKKLMELGQWFETLPEKAGRLGSVLEGIGASGTLTHLASEALRFGGIVIDLADHWGKVGRKIFDAAGGFPGLIAAGREVIALADSFGKGARSAVDSILGGIDSLIAKSRDWLSMSGVPSFLQSSLAAVQSVIDKIGQMATAVQTAAAKAAQMTPSEKRQQLDGGWGGGLGESPRLGPLVRDPGERGENSGLGPLVADPGARGEPISGALQETFRNLINANEEQVKAANAGADAAREGADAAKQTPDAVKSMGEMVAGRVSNGVTVWSSGNSAVKSGVDQNTSSTREGLKSVESAVNAAAAAMAAAASRGGGPSPSSGDGWHTGTTGGNVYGNEMRDADGDGFATTNSWEGKRSTFTLDKGMVLSGAAGYGYEAVPLNPRNPSTVGLTGLLGSSGLSTRRDLNVSDDAPKEDLQGDLDRALISAFASPVDRGVNEAPAVDPYKARNPDYFYNNTTGMAHKEKSGDDWMRKLPADIAKALTDALIRAGLGGDKIGEAIVQAGSRPTAAPTPQDGWLPNRGPLRGGGFRHDPRY